MPGRVNTQRSSHTGSSAARASTGQRAKPPESRRPGVGLTGSLSDRSSRSTYHASTTASSPRVNKLAAQVLKGGSTSARGSSVARTKSTNSEASRVKLNVKSSAKSTGAKLQVSAGDGRAAAKPFSALNKLKKAVNMVKMANRLANYTAQDTGRKPEEARKKAEKKQLKVVWKSVDLDGSGMLDRHDANTIAFA